MQLDLSYNHLCGLDDDGLGTYDASGIRALADALAVHAPLTLLDLQYNQLGDEGEHILHQANTRRGKPAELKM